MEETLIAYIGTDEVTAQEISKKGVRPSNFGIFGRGNYVTTSKINAECLGRTIVKVQITPGRVLTNPSPEEWENWNEKGYDSVHMEGTETNPNREQHCIYDSSRVQFIEIIYKKN